MNRVLIGDNSFMCEDGTDLSALLISSGAEHSHPCGRQGICKKCAVLVNGKKELSCQYKIYSDITVTLSEENNIFSDEGLRVHESLSREHCFILDIGTTTVALALIDTKNRSAIKVITEKNPQSVYGADVISRIEGAKKYGTGALQKILVDKINSMLSSFPENNAHTLFVAGNTVMLHLFFGINPQSMGVFPYTPVFLEEKRCRGEEIGISSIKSILSLPCLSSFVGADIVAGLNSVPFPKNNKYSILVDLGTNAEIVLFSEKEILCTSAAAGPCFEGVGISCGMSASEGAIYEYRCGTDFSVIGNKKARGICSTALIDIIAVLLGHGIIDETGYLEKDFAITEDVFLSPKDVRQFQNGKAAIYSGVATLLKRKKLTAADIDTLYISGGFSSRLNIENAVLSGIIPREMKNKCVSLKNSCLAGLINFSCSETNQLSFTPEAEYIDLACDKDFSESYISNMLFDCP